MKFKMAGQPDAVTTLSVQLLLPNNHF